MPTSATVEYSPTNSEITFFTRAVSSIENIPAPDEAFVITSLNRLVEELNEREKKDGEGSVRIGDYVALSDFYYDFDINPGMASEISTLDWAKNLGKLVGIKTDNNGQVLQYEVLALDSKPGDKPIQSTLAFSIEQIGKIVKNGSVLKLNPKLLEISLTNPNNNYEYVTTKRLHALTSLLQLTTGELLESSSTLSDIIRFGYSERNSALDTLNASLSRIEKEFTAKFVPIDYEHLNIGDVIVYLGLHEIKYMHIQYLGTCKTSGISQAEQMFSFITLERRKARVTIDKAYTPDAFLFSTNNTYKPENGRVFSAEAYPKFLEELSAHLVNADGVFNKVLMSAIHIPSSEFEKAKAEVARIAKYKSGK